MRSCESTSGFNLSANADGLGIAGALNTDIDGSIEKCRLRLEQDQVRSKKKSAVRLFERID